MADAIAPTDVLLSVEGLEAGYGEVQVLWGLSLKARRGKLTAIVGANGAGNTTTLRAVAGTLTPWGGRVMLDGEDVTRVPSHAKAARGLALVPEGRQLFSAMSVAENLALRSFDGPPIAKFGFLLDRVAIREVAGDSVRRFSIRTPSVWAPIRNLSGGNVQRAVLARDLGSGEAKIVVVANPCFGLDFAATAFVHNQLIELRNSGGSVLLVSEDLDELMKIADRVVVMSGGEIAHETLRAELDLAEIGRYMGGHCREGDLLARYPRFAGSAVVTLRGETVL